MRSRIPGAVVVLAFALGASACTSTGSNTSPRTTHTVASALSSLVPGYQGRLTPATAKTGTVRAADNIQALIASTEIVHVDDGSKLVDATGSSGAFYGVERAITTRTGFDALSQGIAMEKLLVAAGWTRRQENTSTTAYTVQLTAPTGAGTAALFLQADVTPGAPPVILIELESPDLPKS